MTSPDCVSAGLGIDVIEADGPCFGVWHPIETAPKHGLIDIWIKSGVRWTDCWYDQICHEWRTSGASGHLAMVRASSVTHWMPIPDGPEAAGGQGA